ncbi:uncharacterized protein LOC124265974 isoform X4 [Haliotis rubra]|uniref:uncharacterized protein LOC124265974 isoform X4 n=1 Tax=Haliotis rubra TaxID=36100 RepID=UPI001EE52359|nr:uncharacterized protein LOC124265974 isoform X4 [Haliotis rubra]
MAVWTSAVLWMASLSLAAVSAAGVGQNVARGKPAWMSTGRGATRVASNAVDGVTTATEAAYAVHTQLYHSFAWWKVDLQIQVQSAVVNIYFRTDYVLCSDKDRRNGLNLFTSGTNSSDPTEGHLCHSRVRLVVMEPAVAWSATLVTVTTQGTPVILTQERVQMKAANQDGQDQTAQHVHLGTMEPTVTIPVLLVTARWTPSVTRYMACVSVDVRLDIEEQTAGKRVRLVVMETAVSSTATPVTVTTQGTPVLLTQGSVLMQAANQDGQDQTVQVYTGLYVDVQCQFIPVCKSRFCY